MSIFQNGRCHPVMLLHMGPHVAAHGMRDWHDACLIAVIATAGCVASCNGSKHSDSNNYHCVIATMHA